MNLCPQCWRAALRASTRPPIQVARQPPVRRSLHTDAAGALQNQLRLINERLPRRQSITHDPAARKTWFTNADTRSGGTQDTALLEQLSKYAKERDVDAYLDTLNQMQQQGKLYQLHELHFLVGLRLTRPKPVMPTSPPWQASDVASTAPAPLDWDAGPTEHSYGARMLFLLTLMDRVVAHPSLETFLLRLEHARFRRKPALATQVWQKMAELDMTPDVFCYNSYIAATSVPRDIFDAFRLRKRLEAPDVVYSRERYMSFAEEASRRAVVLYQEMVRRGVQPNTHTIELLILALGRACNLSAVRSIIKQTWAVSASDSAWNWEAAQMNGIADEIEEEGLESATEAEVPVLPKYDATSPLFPTAKTLMAIIHAFGVHSQSSLAFDYILRFSQVYNTNITSAAMTKLMQLAFADSELNGGFTDSEQVMRFFDHVQEERKLAPTLGMYAIAISTAITQVRMSRAQELLDAALQSVEEGKLTGYKAKPGQVRHIVRSVLSKINRILLGKLRRTANRVKRAEDDQGDYDIQLSKAIFDKREAHLRELHMWWVARMAAHMDKTQAGTQS